MANVFYLFHVKEVSNKKKTRIVLSSKTIVWFQSTGLCDLSSEKCKLNYFRIIKGQIRHSYLN